MEQRQREEGSRGVCTPKLSQDLLTHCAAAKDGLDVSLHLYTNKQTRMIKGNAENVCELGTICGVSTLSVKRVSSPDSF